LNNPPVFFTAVTENESMDTISKKVHLLFQNANLGSCVNEKDLVAIKLHFGEEGNNTYLSPHLVRPVVEEIKKNNSKPFLTDTCVLYRSQRDNAVAHLHLAYKHGFTIENTGAPVIIADGLLGGEEREIKINGNLFDKVSIASVALDSNALIVMSHVTGHMNSGLGAAIKNIGMGFATRKGKLRQHAVMKPKISKEACTGCEICVGWCPTDAILMKNEIAWINSELCIGCGECLTVCRFSAVKHDWGMTAREMQARMAEHAMGVVTSKPGKVGFLNFLIKVTKDCDCIGQLQKPVIPDIGILASNDPVAIDSASLDLIKEKSGKSLADLTYPGIDPWIQIRHGKDVGLGMDTYELIEI
jgi:uncharacterized Fe-S center protein